MNNDKNVFKYCLLKQNDMKKINLNVNGQNVDIELTNENISSIEQLVYGQFGNNSLEAIPFSTKELNNLFDDKTKKLTNFGLNSICEFIVKDANGGDVIRTTNSAQISVLVEYKRIDFKKHFYKGGFKKNLKNFCNVINYLANKEYIQHGFLGHPIYAIKLSSSNVEVIDTKTNGFEKLIDVIQNPIDESIEENDIIDRYCLVSMPYVNEGLSYSTIDRLKETTNVPLWTNEGDLDKEPINWNFLKKLNK